MRYGFYCDPYLDFEYHEDRRGLRRARLIIRLLNLLRPTHVWMPDADKRITTAIYMIMPRLRVATQKKCPEDTDFIITFNRKDMSELWHKMDALEECGLLAFNYSEKLSDSETLELSSKDFRIFLRRTGMARLMYEL